MALWRKSRHRVALSPAARADPHCAMLRRQPSARRVTMPAMIGRRELIAAFGGAAAWPLAARAQQSAMLRVGVVSGQPKSASFHAAFEQRIAELGYHRGKNFAFEFLQAASI